MSVLDRPFFNLSVIKAPVAEVAQAFDRYPPMRVHGSPTSFVLPEQPYTEDKGAPPLILWSPANAPGLTVFMPHLSAGDGYVPAYAQSTFRFDVISIRSTADDCRKDAVNEFSAYSQGALLRFVRVMSDNPGWDFYQKGDPLSFENLEKYQLRLKRKRLQRGDVLACVESWGAPITSAMFWRSDFSAVTFLPKGPAPSALV